VQNVKPPAQLATLRDARNGITHMGWGRVSSECRELLAAGVTYIDSLMPALEKEPHWFRKNHYEAAKTSVFKAWLDQIMIVGRTFGFADGAPTASRPAVVISARGGGYGPGSPNEGKDYLVPTLETILGWSHMLGLDVTTVTPELTMAPDVPAMAELVPLHQTSLAAAHEQAGQLAEAFASSAA
jgi:FMN-dependent NADH-azoreductase